MNNEILELEKSYEDNINLITQKKIELEEIRKHKLKGSLIRSRAKWITEGEKPTNYFFNLENRHYSSKIIPKIITEDDIEITNQNEILKEANYEKRLLLICIHHFYSDVINNMDHMRIL